MITRAHVGAILGDGGIEMRIEHVALYVEDLEAARSFFMRYFGAASNELYHNPATGFRSYFLSFDDGARLEIMTRPNLAGSRQGETKAGYAHVALSVGSKRAVDELTRRLGDDGYEVLSGPRTTGDGYYESCVVAVEGNLIEITV